METELLLTGLGVVVLLALSGLFSGSETALTAASRARMHQLERKGNRKALLVNRLLQQRERLIGALLLGNNLVNIMASALATSLLIALFGKAGVAYATMGMTVLVLIFSEVLPKTYALQNSDKTALALAPVIRVVVVLFGPVVHVVQMIVAGTLRIFGVRLTDGGHIIDSSEELRGTLDLQSREGAIVKSDKDMLDGILDLADVDLSAIMVHRKSIVMIDAALKPSEIVRELLRSGFSRVPLYQEDTDNIVGILHAKDLLRAMAEDPSNFERLDIASLLREPWFVPDTTSLLEQLNAFQSRHEHIALVVDEYGALMGLVTLEDILEEIVGEIADEHDIARSGQIRQEPSGSFIVDGTLAVRDLNRECDWELPEEEAATVAGLAIHIAKRLPVPGERFSLHGFQFEILRRQRNQITLLRIRPPAEHRQEAADPATPER